MKPLLNFLSKNYEKITIIVILVVAAFYRLYRIQDFITFLGDEGRDALIVYGILHGDLTLLGPTASVGGFFLGPIYYYFMVPFLWLFNYNPVGPAVMVALFGIATVWLIYKIGKEFFGSTVGLIASGLYAISPLVVIYSRSSWNPNLMPFFSLLMLYVLYKALVKNSYKLFVLSGFLLGILMQLHYLSVFLGIIVAFYVLLSKWQKIQKKLIAKTSRQYLFILLGYLIGWSPFLAFEMRHGFKNIASIFNFIFNPQGSGVIHFPETVSSVFFRVFGRLITNIPASGNLSAGVNPYWSFFTLIFGIVGFGFLTYKTYKEYKTYSSDLAKYLLLFLWFIFGVGLFGLYRKTIYDYYFGLLFPLPFFITGILLKDLLSKNKTIKVFGVALLLVLFWLNCLNPPFLSPANRQLAQAETIAKFVIDKTDNEPYNFALLTAGNSDHAYRYFFALWGKPPVEITNPALDPQRKTVTDQLLVVCETTPNCGPLGHSLWEIAGFGRAEIVGEWHISVVQIFKLEHYKGE